MCRPKLTRTILFFAIFVTVLVVHADDDPLGEPTKLTIYAYDFDSKGHIVSRQGVTCLALSADGAKILGITKHEGEVTLSYSNLFRPEHVALLFCPPGAQVNCSAIRLDLPHLRGFAEYNVRVTGPEMICRQKAKKS